MNFGIRMPNKRLQVARILMAVGAHQLVANWRGASLIVVNYHRIRPTKTAASRFDDGVFETDVETLREQLHWLHAHTTVLDEAALLGMLQGFAPQRGAMYSLITIDDGYIDCHTLIRPVLDELGIRGIFFMPVEMLESRRLGWWDQTAYMLKKCDREAIAIDGLEYSLKSGTTPVLKRVLDQFKLEKSGRTVDLLEKISVACGVSPPPIDEQSAELLDWSQVRELQAAGHSIGSHALTHRVLATLSREEQSREVIESRRALEEITGGSIRSFAYPVGGPRHYDCHSVESVRDAGYRLAFTFNTGVSMLPLADPLQIPRESANSLDVLKAKSLVPWVLGIKQKRAA